MSLVAEAADQGDVEQWEMLLREMLPRLGDPQLREMALRATPVL